MLTEPCVMFFSPSRAVLSAILRDEYLTSAVGTKELKSPSSGAPNDNFRKNICSEDDLRARIFETFVVKFLACLLFLGFSNI